MSLTKVRFIVLLGVICVSFSAILIRYSNAPSLVISTMRMLITVILLFPFFIYQLSHAWSKLPKKSFLLPALSGVFLAFHFATWIESIKYTSIASSTVLVNLQSTFVYFGGALFLNERLKLKSFLSLCLALIGSFAITLGDASIGSNLLYGDFLALCGALFIACYMLIGRYARKHLSLTLYTFVVYCSATLTLSFMTVLKGYTLLNYPPKEYLIFFLLAVICTLMGHSLFNWALKYLKPASISINILGEPVFASIWAIFLFQEIPSLYQFFGAVIILLGIFFFIRIESSFSS